MPLANKKTGGIERANYRGVDLQELGYATEILTDDDVHFGVNLTISGTGLDLSPLANRLQLTDPDKNIPDYGPRVIDALKRNGTIAEVLWEHWKDDPTAFEVSGFLSFFEDFNKSIPRIEKRNFPQGAKAIRPGGNVVDLSGVAKYGPDEDVTKGSGLDLTNPNMDALTRIYGGTDEAFEVMGSEQFGTRWSKTALEMVIRGRWGNGTGKVHFHLDGMGDLHEIVERSGDTGTYSAKTAYNVTSRELRYLKRNWKTIKPKDKVVFYNGYSDDFRAVRVACPWPES